MSAAQSGNQRGGPGGAIDITTLSPHELLQLRKTVEEDIAFLEESLRQLQGVVSKFGQARAVIKTINPKEHEGAEILVPLTSSLYVPGEMIETDKVMIDIGTGFYVEKTLEQGVEYCDRRAKFVMQNAKQVSMLLEAKSKDLRSLDAVLQQRLQALQAMQAK